MSDLDPEQRDCPDCGGYYTGTSCPVKNCERPKRPLVALFQEIMKDMTTPLPIDTPSTEGHSPLTWRILKDRDDYEIVDANDFTVAELQVPHGGTVEEMLANAGLIIRAVNEREALQRGFDGALAAAHAERDQANSRLNVSAKAIAIFTQQIRDVEKERNQAHAQVKALEEALKLREDAFTYESQRVADATRESKEYFIELKLMREELAELRASHEGLARFVISKGNDK